MKKRSGIFTFRKKKARGEGYVTTLIQTLESIDFAQAQKAVEALGEAADPAAIKTLVSLIKGSAALRAAATASLKKNQPGERRRSHRAGHRPDESEGEGRR